MGKLTGGLGKAAFALAVAGGASALLTGIAMAQSGGGQKVTAPADPSTLVPAPRPEDVSSPHALTTALYDVISGDAGVKRDWNRFRSLFHPKAQMMPTGRNAETGKVGVRVWSPEDYVNMAGPNLERDGFHEREVAYREERFGNTAHIFTTYAAKRKQSDAEPFMRGINSIQFYHDGTRWWVLNITWSSESPDSPIPQKYMTSAQ